MNLPTTQSSFPWVSMNGRLMPAERAVVSVFDRSFQLGDGIFESLRVMAGCPLEWAAHWRRFQLSSKWSGIRLPLSQPDCRKAANAVIRKNRATDAVLRLHLSRGVGARGYSPASAKAPLLVFSLHPLKPANPGQPEKIRLLVSTHRIAAETPLARHKTASRILNVLAKAEAEAAGFDDALFLDDSGFVAEAVSSNLFWIHCGTICTAPLTSPLLPGTTRSAILALCRRLKLPVAERRARVGELQRADGVFLTVSTTGVLEVTAIGEQQISRSPLTSDLQAALENHWLKTVQRQLRRKPVAAKPRSEP